MMRLWSELRERLRALLFGGREDAELEEELAFHLERDIAASRARGLSDAEAVRAARLKFGSADRFTEETRDARGVRVLSDFAQDLRLAGREMRRRPGFAAVAVLTLAIGMAGVTAVFSITSRLLLRPLPGVESPAELVTVRFEEDRLNDTGLSWLNYHELAPALSAFASFAGYTSVQLQVLPPGGRGLNLSGSAIVGDYFRGLGLTPAYGRFFTEQEMSDAGAGDIAVISHRLWQDMFGGGDVRGSAMRINGLAFSIIGVAPAGFHGPGQLEGTDVWFPPVAYGGLRHFSSSMLGNRGADLFRDFFARLAPGATLEQAHAQLVAAMDRLVTAYPLYREQYELARPRIYAGIGLDPAIRDGVHRTLRLMFGIAALVLLIACANVANLLLFRALRSRGESAVRRALGASTLRVLQQHGAQGLMLAGAGGAVALLLVTVSLRGVSSIGIPGVAVEAIPIDVRVLTFAAALVLSTAILFALVPTLLSRRMDLVTNLREAARSETGRAGWLRRGLVVVQIALSAALIVPATLLTRSVANLGDVELGFDPSGIVAFGVSPEPQGYTDEQTAVLQQRLLEEARAHADIESAALAATMPFGGGSFSVRMRGPLQPENVEPVRVALHWVGDGFFPMLRIAFVHPEAETSVARALAAPEAGDGIVLSRSAALQLFGGVDVIGRSVEELGFSGPQTRRVIGVVGDVRTSNLREPPAAAVYRPIADGTMFGAFFLLARPRAGRAQAEMAVTDALAAIDPAIPLFATVSIDEGIERAIAAERMFARLSAVLGILAAFLAAIGLYGLMGYSVARRTREIGIRMALGARVTRVIMMVTGETIRIAAVGIVAGCIGGWALARVLQTMLFGVAPFDPATYAGAALLFTAIALVAAMVPAYAAATVEPTTALRTE